MLHFIDIAVFAGFIALVMAVGLWKSRSAKSEEGGAADYFLAGRGLKWWLIGISLIAANISAEQFVGMSGSAAGPLGLAIASYEWMAAVTLIVVAFAFLPYFLRTGIYTIPQFLEHRYNPVARAIMAVFMMIVLVGVTFAAVVYAGALPMCELFQHYGLNISLTQCCWIMGGLAAAYVAAGGLKACAWADLIQGTALIIGGGVIAYLAFRALGAADPSALVPGIGESGAAPAVAAIPGGAVPRFFALNGDKLHMVLSKTNPDIPWTALCLGLWIPNLYYWGLNQYITQRMLGSASLAEGQKGIVFAAALKLIIPFIIVMPGLIAFNLYTRDMVDSVANSPKILQANAEALAELDNPASRALITADPYWAANPANAQDAARVAAHNARVASAGAEGAPKLTEKTLTGIQYDSALGLLIKKLLAPGKGLLGFVLAALLGAIISSLAAVLNAASTIFSMDIYGKYLNRRATPGGLVRVGRICIGVFVVIGCLLAPELNNPKLGGIFKYIQEFQGYVSPGFLAVFIFGLLNRTANGWTGVVGLVLNPILYFLLATLFPGLSFLNRMAVCMTVLLALMWVLGQFMRLPQPVVFSANTRLDVCPSKGAKIGGLCVVLAAVLLYVVFW